MIMDHYSDKWMKPSPPTPILPDGYPAIPYVPPQPHITPEEVAELKKLLERAREYDKKHNEPDCELESKKQKLLKLAKELGVEIDFL